MQMSLFFDPRHSPISSEKSRRASVWARPSPPPPRLSLVKKEEMTLNEEKPPP